jgi:uncharacterized protein (DUF2126 family)
MPCASHTHELDERKTLHPADKVCKVSYMARKTTGTMTELLRAALLEAPSLNAIQKATGVTRQTLAAFMRGEQVSIHLASADALADYFGIVCTMSAKPKRKGG